MQSDLSIFERKYAMYILLAVADNPRSGKSDIVYMERGNFKTKFVRIEELIQTGYLEVTAGEHWKTMALVLTPKGEKAVEAIRRLHDLIMIDDGFPKDFDARKTKEE